MRFTTIEQAETEAQGLRLLGFDAWSQDYGSEFAVFIQTSSVHPLSGATLVSLKCFLTADHLRKYLATVSQSN